MKSTTNAFLGGLKQDSHPLTTEQNFLTDALNATLITYNGNEMMLQNDMGNTKIQDSTTGNIMGLRDGFIPLGMKEHGGILYIASLNLQTKEGQLGTIPSPVFNYMFQDCEPQLFDNPIMCGGQGYEGDTLIHPINKFLLYTQTPFRVCHQRLFVGDKFLLSFVVDEIERRSKRNCWIGDKKNSMTVSSIPFPMISQAKTVFVPTDSALRERYYGPGWMKLCLQAQMDNSKNIVSLNQQTEIAAKYYPLAPASNPFDPIEQDYWFIADLHNITDSLTYPFTGVTKIDTELNEANLSYIGYPNLEPGQLYVRIEPELPHSFKLSHPETVQVVYPINITIPPNPGGYIEPDGDEPPGLPVDEEIVVPDVPFLDQDDSAPDDTVPNYPNTYEQYDKDEGGEKIELNPFLLPFDHSSFDVDKLKGITTPYRLRSPFKVLQEYTVGTTDEQYEENSAYDTTTVSYFTCSALKLLEFEFKNTDGSTEYMPNYVITSNQLNNLPYNQGAYSKCIQDDVGGMRTVSLEPAFYSYKGIADSDKSKWKFLSTSIRSRFDCTGEIPHFRAPFRDSMGLQYCDPYDPDPTVSDVGVNSLFVYNDPDTGDKWGGSYTVVTGGKQYLEEGNSTGQFGLYGFSPDLFYALMAQTYRVPENIIKGLETSENSTIEDVGCLPQNVDNLKWSNFYLNIPYRHEKAIVAHLLYDGVDFSGVGNKYHFDGLDNKYALSLIIFPYLHHPTRVKNADGTYAYLSRELGQATTINYIQYRQSEILTEPALGYWQQLAQFQKSAYYSDGVHPDFRLGNQVSWALNSQSPYNIRQRRQSPATNSAASVEFSSGLWQSSNSYTSSLDIGDSSQFSTGGYTNGLMAAGGNNNGNQNSFFDTDDVTLTYDISIGVYASKEMDELIKQGFTISNSDDPVFKGPPDGLGNYVKNNGEGAEWNFAQACLVLPLLTIEPKHIESEYGVFDYYEAVSEHTYISDPYLWHDDSDGNDKHYLVVDAVKISVKDEEGNLFGDLLDSDQLNKYTGLLTHIAQHKIINGAVKCLHTDNVLMNKCDGIPKIQEWSPDFSYVRLFLAEWVDSDSSYRLVNVEDWKKEKYSSEMGSWTIGSDDWRIIQFLMTHPLNATAASYGYYYLNLDGLAALTYEEDSQKSRWDVFMSYTNYNGVTSITDIESVLRGQGDDMVLYMYDQSNGQLEEGWGRSLEETVSLRYMRHNDETNLRTFTV